MGKITLISAVYLAGYSLAHHGGSINPGFHYTTEETTTEPTTTTTRWSTTSWTYPVFTEGKHA